MLNTTNASALPGPTTESTLNPWQGQFGPQQVVEVIYLTLLAVVGTAGNLILIFSIVVAKKIYQYGNCFIINLALADLIITGIYTPSVIANVFQSGNALSKLGCQIFGYVIITACSCSMWNLAFIALNRYWAIVRNDSYNRVFSRKHLHVMVTYTWVYSVIVTMPTVLGWTTLIYDYKSMVCAWDDTASLSFCVFLICGAILLPLAATIFCYWKLFWHVRSHARRLLRRATERESVERRPSNRSRKSMQREISLIKTLATAVVIFVLCWTPYSFCILINPKTVDPLIKKICTWLGLNNSAVNFIIYGLMNVGFRRGYKNLLLHIFPCFKNRSMQRTFARNATKQEAQTNMIASYRRTIPGKTEEQRRSLKLMDMIEEEK